MSSQVVVLAQLFRDLSVDDHQQFLDILCADENVKTVIEPKSITHCPHCTSGNWKKNGTRRDGVQRYLCHSCGRSFLGSTGTILSYT